MKFRWEGDGFLPANAYVARRCDQVFVIGQSYQLAEHNDRSGESHRHFFAQVKEAWEQLPEHMTERFPSAEHLRKYALIKAGFYDSHSMTFDTEADAERVAAFMEPTDEFAVIIVDETTVTRFTAKSQSYRDMDRKTFQESKDRTLDVIAKMIDVSRRDLERNSGKAA